MMKLSEIKSLLAKHNLVLTKSLGQNFLHDANQLRRIIQAAELTPADKVLEIGPGLGPLTSLLVRDAAKVVAIEKDQRLVNILGQRLADAKNLELIHADAWDHLKENRDWQEWKVVSNLPYSAASRIVVELAQMERSPALMVVTLQLEVAERIAAQAGSEHYGLLTLLVQLGYSAAGQFKIPGTCFFPEPEVDSACITLRRRDEPLVPLADKPVFLKIGRQAFSQRRKMMFKLLKQHWPEARLGKAFAETGLDAKVRAEAVSLEQFVNLTRLLQRESEP